jgi:uncharacterized membrane protein
VAEVRGKHRLKPGTALTARPAAQPGHLPRHDDSHVGHENLRSDEALTPPHGFPAITADDSGFPAANRARTQARPARAAGTAAAAVRSQPPVPSIGAIVLIVANVLTLADIRVPFIGPAVGFGFLVIGPIYLLFTTDIWRGSPAVERLGYSVTAGLLLLMLGGLTINTILPPLGITRPLDPVPIVILGDVLTAALYELRRRRPAPVSWRAYLAALPPSATRLLIAATLCPALAVLGANRLNNDAGDEVSLVTLGLVVVLAIAMLRWRRQLSDAVISVAVYLISLAFLLMTSLRGWSVTGHDIQSEYRVFQLTEAHGRWELSAFHTAYNACLSITILPTEISRVVNVDDPYVYKVFFQILFALCPVMVYTIARRFASKYVSLLAIIYFVGFPTYYNDMPFINRQEIAFLFVCASVLAVTNSRWPQSRRRAVFLIAALGVELSHYSTMYLLLGTVAVCWLAGSVIRIGRRLRRKAMAGADQRAWQGPSRTVGLGSVLTVAAMVALWGGLATQSAGPLVTDLANAVSELGHANSATSYGVLSRTSLTPQQVLDDYRAAALKQNAATPGALYLPYNTVARYPTPLDNEPSLPLTTVGRTLNHLGIPVATVNTDVRQGAAKDEQLFIAAGFGAFLVSGRFRRRVSHEVIYLCAGSILMVGVFTAFPALSIDYGVLRALQEALILTAPLLVIGSVALFSPFGEKWSLRIAGIICLGIFTSTIGLMPQLLGGYPAQLSLNNSGQYYDIYYVHPQDVAAVNWLAGKPGVLPSGLQASLGPFTSDMFAFNSLSDVNGNQFVYDLYPALIQRKSWVLLNYALLRSGRAPLESQGELLTYAYPTQLLQATKNLVYNNGGAEIYK